MRGPTGAQEHRGALVGDLGEFGGSGARAPVRLQVPRARRTRGRLGTLRPFLSHRASFAGDRHPDSTQVGQAIARAAGARQSGHPLVCLRVCHPRWAAAGPDAPAINLGAATGAAHGAAAGRGL